MMYSGHPMGLFPSSPQSPRVVVTNGMVCCLSAARAVGREGNDGREEERDGEETWRGGMC